ncbi:TPA: phosphoglycolate phosphatase [Vibrio vulnificus]|uniref:Phosphoglycolate phosphatase n=1 Tax=Vibrio vulnificus (strain YJ016) TaxID=196600 RepID=GPH_VIBVY|nr:MULTISPECIES: phosphoglycolate phosphatase [Vibrio]Q7MH14.2 RecName: Full=Phosphoglycolate phosphatase; Short=PGP; Short=PGPase [Vibrio vulnificus YJ016]EHH0750640.1 phosphoglycolate phosphatase [Vibrio vulnificus]MCG6313948.1 phosphoglycolate phosphatase [Vibrio vulnificus]NVC63328.1 phosphoglycolate phosphatase [Vibrio sp. 05-20-BW147]PWY30381.1 phosphoglycolate phosphatase [Vibrio vulnificus]HAS6198443.1 phosphoglycolate phosphatase [Vibrio vulnificus]
MTQQEIKLIAFDLDGTLLDSVPDLAVAADQATRAVGFPGVTELQVRDYVGNGADILIGRALSQSLTINPELSDELRAQARELFDDFYQQTGHKLSHLYPTVKETLKALHQAGFTLALVTNKPSKFVPDVLQQHGIADYFVDVLGGDSFPEKKPNPIALNWLMEKHQIQPTEMLMVGDSKNDILAAKNAGCASFGLTYGYNHGEPISASEPDFVADSLAQLLDVVLVSA